MAVLMTQTMPEGVTVEVLDEVTEEMGVRGEPPAGMVVHVHYDEGGKTHIVDVWDSTQAYETFARERLGPAMEKVAQRRGLPAPADRSMPDVREVHAVIRGQ